MTEIYDPHSRLNLTIPQTSEKCRIPKSHIVGLRKPCFDILLRNILSITKFGTINNDLLEVHLVLGKGTGFISENILDLS
jgi:hypothetical protein